MKDPNGFELQDDGVVTSAAPVVGDEELREQLRKALGMCDDKSCPSRCFQQLNVAMSIIKRHITSYGDRREIELLETLLPGMIPSEYSLWVRTQICSRLDTLKKKEAERGN